MTPDEFEGSPELSGAAIAPILGLDFDPAVLGSPAPMLTVPTRELRQIGGELQLLSGTHALYRPVSAPPAVAEAPRYQIYIDGVLRSDKVSIARQPVSINMALGQWANATFSAISLDGTYRPTQDQEVIIIDTTSGVRLFGGYIDSPGEQHQQGTDIIWTSVTAVGYGSKLDRRGFGAYYDLTFVWTPQSLVRDIFLNEIADTGITLGSSTDGAVFTTEILLPWDWASANIRRILEPSGLDIVVDAYAQAHIVSKTAGYSAAPFNVTDVSGTCDVDTLKSTRERGRYANRVIVIPDIREPGFWNDSWAGTDAVGLYGFYQTKYILNSKPIVQVNGVTKTVGEYWTSAAENDFTYVPGGNGVYSSTGAYGAGDTVDIYYPIPLQPVVIAQDDAEIASFGAIVDAIEQVRDVYDRDRLIEIAQGILARRMTRPYLIEYTTQQQGARPGMTQVIDTTRPLVDNITILIDSVSGSYVPTSSGGFFRWQIKGGNSAILGQGSQIRTNQKVRAELMRPQDRIRQIFRWDVAKTVDGLTNPGVSAMTLHGSHEITRPGFIKEVRLRFDTVPQNEVLQIDVLLNGVTVFANGEYIEFRQADGANTITSYNFSTIPLALVPTDRLTAEVITGDVTAKDGILEVEQQG